MSRNRRTASPLPRCAFVALFSALALAHPLVAQDPYPDPDEVGLVMRVHTETVTPRLSEDKDAGFGELLMYIRYSRQLLEHLTDPFDRAPPPEEHPESVEAAPPAILDYTIYVKDDRMRVDMGSSSLLARLAPDGSVAEWGVLDPGSGRVVQSDYFDEAVRERSTEPYDPAGGTGDNVELKVAEDPAPTGETDEILGHVAREYQYSYELHIYPLGRRPAGPDRGTVWIQVETTGTAWVAEEGPYVGNPDAASVFRVFVQSHPSKVATLADRGLLLAVSESSTISLVGADEPVMLGFEALETSSSFEVTSIDLQPVDDALLAGFEQGKQACDCSCAAFEELKQLQEEDPNAMGKAMCSAECAMRWATECTGGGR